MPHDFRPRSFEPAGSALGELAAVRCG